MKKHVDLKSALRASTAALALATAGLALSPAQAIVGNNSYPPASLVDTNNVTGIGQMVIDQQNGYIGLCTATLINPRTVIFASHCVNETEDADGNPAVFPASGYGSAFGGKPIAFFFNADNNVKGNSAIGHWLYGTATDPTSYVTRPNENTYNANYVIYNTRSVEYGAATNFYQADIAMAALDTPATDVPTWALLFSPLTSPTHATIAGYGNNGTGTKGATGSDYRRRIAENTISMLGSLDDVDGFLFGETAGWPQNLYLVDFNDPAFGTKTANRYDFNIFHDAALQKEGITAPGDSGGPLIVDQLFSQQVVAAVLSGGSRYFSKQPSASYGTTSFYQPLYLFWDWIVTNNPYKYVSAKAGDGSWTDPTHWVINLDPNYVTTDANGNLVNALPTTDAQGIPAADGVNTPKFGQVCYFNDCVDIVTGKETIYPTTAAAGSSDATIGQVISSGSPDIQKFEQDSSDTVATDPMMGLVKQWLSSQSAGGLGVIASSAAVDGMPGSSNFVPADTDGDPTTGKPARYYDVTLNAAGTTTLSGAEILIDKLTINGASTGLTIASDSFLGVYIDTTMLAGNLRVDGALVSNGDIGLLGGVLSGKGQVVAPYVTAVLGAIAPGTAGTTGTLSVTGNVVLSSKSGFLVDIASTSVDRLDVSGSLTLGGSLVVSPVSGYKPKWHETRIIATAADISGKFDSVPDTIQGVLYPVVKTVAGSSNVTEVLTFEAVPFTSVLTNATPDQLHVASLLDGDRTTSYQWLTDLYNSIDTLSGSELTAALDAMVPNATRSIPQVSKLMIGAQTGYLWQYLGAMDPDGEAKVAMQTDALKLAQNSRFGSFEMRSLLSGLGSNSASDAGTGSSGGSMALPKGVGAFLVGQKIDGFVSLGGTAGKADVDGFMVSAGVDVSVYDGVRVGFTYGFGEADTSVRNQPAHTKTSMNTFIGYGSFMAPDGYFVNAFAGYGTQAIHTVRLAAVGATTYTLEGHASATTPILGADVGYAFKNVLGATIKPAAGIQYGSIDIARYNETGGSAALAFDRYSADNANVRLGIDSQWEFQLSDFTLKPSVHAFWVNRLGRGEGDIVAGYYGGQTKTGFAAAHDGSDWADLGLRLEATDGETAAGFYFNASPGSVGATYTAVGGTLRVKF